ncbi:MAG TPA: hypothetical protein VID27_00435 [Blastocatellia bacterium]
MQRKNCFASITVTRTLRRGVILSGADMTGAAMPQTRSKEVKDGTTF